MEISLGAFCAIIGVLCVYWTILDAFLFKKVGEKPIKALIPVYGLIKKVKILSYDWYRYLFCILLCIFAGVGAVAEKSASSAIATINDSPVIIAVYIASLVIMLIYNIGLAKKFGKSAWFGVGLFFAGLLFKSILAFSKAEAVSVNAKANDKSLIGWRCECGTMNPGYSDTCSKCGNKKQAENS